MTSPARYLRSAAFILALSLPLTTQKIAASTACLPDTYRGVSDRQIDTRVRVIARIHTLGDLSLGGYKGNAIVIDAQGALLLTARHVVRDARTEHDSLRVLGRRISLVFPRNDDYEQLVAEAEVVAIHTRPANESESGSHDLALLRVIDPPPSTQTGEPLLRDEVEVDFLRGSDNRQIDVMAHSLFHASPAVSSWQATAVPISNPDNTLDTLPCMMTFAESVAGGDSGGLVSRRPSGHAVGIILTDFRTERGAQGRFLPTICMRPWLIDEFSKLEAQRVEEVKRLLLDQREVDLARFLANRDPSSKASNLLLNAALGEIYNDVISGQFSDGEEIGELFLKYNCQIKIALAERGGQLPPAVENELLIELATRTTRNGTLREEADALLREARNLASEDPTSAIVLSHAARSFYLADIRQVTSDQQNSVPLIVTQIEDLSEIDARKRQALAQSYKGLADSILLGIDVSGRSRSGTHFEELMIAQGAALSAARLSVDTPSQLSAQSLWTFATAASRAGDLEQAAAGYALIPEVSPNIRLNQSAARAYDQTIGIRDNYLVPKSSPAYLPPNAFVTMQELSIESLADSYSERLNYFAIDQSEIRF